MAVSEVTVIPIKFDALLLVLGVSLLPVYVFPSGGVQPAHLVLALFAGLMLLKRGPSLEAWSLALFAMFFYSLLVEAIYWVSGGSVEYMINSVFFLYNFLLSTAVYLYVRQHGLMTLVPGIFIATSLVCIMVIVNGVDLKSISETGRSTGTFNNPNQLGYFSVCVLSMAYLFYRHGTIGYWNAVGLFVASVFLAIASLSKAAMIANFLVVILALKPASSRRAVIVWLVVAATGLVALAHFYRNGAFDQLIFMQRLLNMFNENDSSLEARGVFALLQGNFFQVFVGLGGEGVSDIVGHEVHSTIGGVINSYGLFGGALFSVVLAVWAVCIQRSYGLLGLVCIAAPAMLYGITHNGIRFAMFWLLFSASLAMARNQQGIRRTSDASRNIELGFSSLSRRGVL